MDFLVFFIGRCVWFFFGDGQHWTTQVFSFCFLFSLARMSLDQQLCPGVGDCKCGAFMSPIFRDPHPTCARCRGVKCTSDVTCDICKDWSVAQWEAFLKKCSYSGCRKSRPSGSALPTALPPIPPSTYASSKAGCPSPSRPPSSLPSEGWCWAGKSGGVSHVGSRCILSPLSPYSGRGGRWARKGLGFWGRV